MNPQMMSAGCGEAEETGTETSSYPVEALRHFHFGKDLKKKRSGVKVTFTVMYPFGICTKTYMV